MITLATEPVANILDDYLEFINLYGYSIEDLRSERTKGDLRFVRTAIIKHLIQRGFDKYDITKALNRHRSTYYHYKDIEISEKFDKRLFEIYQKLIEVWNGKD